MFEFVLLDSHQCNRFLGEPAISNFYPRLPRKSRFKLYKEAGRPLCNRTVNGYRDCIGRTFLPCAPQQQRNQKKISYSSPEDEVLHASGAASSKRVWRARNTKFRLPVGPLRCLAMMSSALARSSSGKSVL